MITAPAISWTNESVKKFAAGADPIQAITRASRELVLRARDAGWTGPPFNPLQIAEMLQARVEANSSIADARLTETESGPKIEFNPTQVRERVRFSIAHEVAHLLFADWSERVRHRNRPNLAGDEWQLEMLCNLAASEFVLPIGSLGNAPRAASIEELMILRRTYDVSTEAFLIRLANVSIEPISAFFASPMIDGEGKRSYRVDYFVSSAMAPRIKKSQARIPKDSVIRECTAIGYTNRAIEDWGLGTSTSIECVGIPAFPGSAYPRVAAWVRFKLPGENRSPIKVLHGNVLDPRQEGPKIVCQMVNDRARRWGGGVARKAAERYPEAEADFRHSISIVPPEERLGTTIFAKAADEITIASMIAQRGYGPSVSPRIRYGALEQCLEAVVEQAQKTKSSIHMPRIGTGAAGGDWATIEELLSETMVRAGLSVTIYDPPPKRQQLELL